jgi:hypothetical protein
MRNDDNTTEFTAAELAWLQQQAAHDPKPRGKSRWQHLNSGRRDRKRREWLRQHPNFRENLNKTAKAEGDAGISPTAKTKPKPEIAAKPPSGFLY